MSPLPDRSRPAPLLGVAALALLAACAGTPGLERARGLLPAASRGSRPALVRAPAADLPPPRTLRARSGELRAIPLEWEPVLAGAVAGYLIERAPAGTEAFRPLAAVEGRFGTVFVDRGAPGASPVAGEPPAEGALLDGTAFAYRVRPFDPEGRLAGRASPVAEATAAPPPPPPERTVAYSHLPRQVALSWTPSADPHVAGYTVERSPSASGPFHVVGRTEGRFATVFVDRGLGDLRLFHYRVRAVNRAGGEGPAGDVVRAVTKPEPLPVHGLAAEPAGLGRNRIRFERNVEPDVVGYRVFRIRSGGARELVAELDADTTEVEDGAVAAGERLAYTAVAVDADGLESAPAPPVEVTSAGYGIALSATPAGVEIRFDPRPAEGFRRARIYRVGRLRSALLGTAEGGRFLDPGPHPPGRTLRYRVVLEDAAGRAAPPSRVAAIEIPAAPPGAQPPGSPPPQPPDPTGVSADAADAPGSSPPAPAAPDPR